MRWTTHRDRETKQSGLTPLDVHLAVRCTQLAQEHGAKRELILSPKDDGQGASEVEDMKDTIDKLDGCSSCKP